MVFRSRLSEDLSDYFLCIVTRARTGKSHADYKADFADGQTDDQLENSHLKSSVYNLAIDILTVLAENGNTRMGLGVNFAGRK